MPDEPVTMFNNEPVAPAPVETPEQGTPEQKTPEKETPEAPGVPEQETPEAEQQKTEPTEPTEPPAEDRDATWKSLGLSLRPKDFRTKAAELSYLEDELRKRSVTPAPTAPSTAPANTPQNPAAESEQRQVSRPEVSSAVYPDRDKIKAAFAKHDTEGDDSALVDLFLEMSNTQKVLSQMTVDVVSEIHTRQETLDDHQGTYDEQLKSLVQPHEVDAALQVLGKSTPEKIARALQLLGEGEVTNSAMAARVAHLEIEAETPPPKPPPPVKTVDEIARQKAEAIIAGNASTTARHAPVDDGMVYAGASKEEILRQVERNKKRAGS